MRALGEDLIDFFNDDFLSVSNPGPLTIEPIKACLLRTKNLDLELEITAKGWKEGEAPDIPEGTIYQSTDRIEFSNPAKTTYIASGVIAQGSRSSSSADGVRTIYRYTIHTLEMRTPITHEPVYVIEWVGNLSKRLIGNSNLENEDTEGSRLEFGDRDNKITIKRVRTFIGSSRVLRVRIGGNDLFIVNTRDSERQKELRSGYILYRTFVPPDERDKMRDCLSFVLGLPIVIFGYTEYDQNDYPLSMKSFPVYAVGGRAFELTDLPPYPIGLGRYQNMPDMGVLETAVNALYRRYEDLRFNELCWTYWHGACAATTMSAVYYGGLCEQLQRIAKQLSGDEGGTLICKKQWKEIENDLQKVIDPLELDPVIRKIVQNKLTGLIQLPQNVALNRLLKQLGLSISEVERAAWQHRNSAAHGNMRSSSNDVILNSRLLRLMFHRLLAAITGCSERYIDYYNLRFPIRRIAEEIPARQTD